MRTDLQSLRTDYSRLKRCAEDLNRYYEGTGIGLWIDSEEEDYGLDLRLSGYSVSGEKIYSQAEVKTMSYTEHEVWDEDGFLRTRGMRNGSCRYGYTGDTRTPQEVIRADRTPKPAWAETDKPLHVLNASVKGGGSEGSKIEKLFERKGYVVFMFEGGYIIFTPRDLKKAIVGYAWLWLQHHKELGDETYSWELKAVIDLSRCTRVVKKKVPRHLLDIRKIKSEKYKKIDG